MINLVMALHCHQPVGNFDHIFQLAHDRCYKPVIDLLAAHPKVRVGVHFSGPLLEWLDNRRPETLDLLAELVRRNQVEPMSGGFFEPLLATIPQEDARGQILMMNDFLEKRLGRRPTGFWLTERIWDPALPSTLAGTDMEYTVVDDTHFYYAGLSMDELFGPYITEREGRTLKLLATPMVMRYKIPFWKVEEAIDQLRIWEAEGKQVAVYGDDGEKFGLWPKTYEWVIQNGWLDNFFSAVEENSDWLRATPPGEYVAATPPWGRLYIPQASYEEMTEWALPPEKTRTLEDMIARLKEENRWEGWRPFVRGGIWDNFLVKYEESNRMHKKMVYFSRLATARARRISGSRETLQQAREFIWRAQCNCAYWHGVFGGLYMGHLRRAIHENLLKAQSLLIEDGPGASGIYQTDYDMDGADEILMHTSISLGVDPAQGGGLFEIAHLPKALNLSDTLTRRPEAYHDKLSQAVVVTPETEDQIASIHDVIKAKEPDLDRFLKYDSYTRISLLDHFYAAEMKPQDLADNQAADIGDFADGVYHVVKKSAQTGTAEAVLSRTGRVGQTSLGVTKSIRLESAPVMNVDYEFEALEGPAVSALYGCEFNLSLFSDEDQNRYLLAPEHGRRREVYEIGGEYQVTRFDLMNLVDGLKISFQFTRPTMVFFFPLMTVSMSEDGFEKTYQGTSLQFLQPVDIQPRGKETFQLRMELVEV